MNIVCVIPARYNSSRFPGKPLADICGKPMIWWVYQEAKKVKYFKEIYIATESEEIVKVCKEFDFKVILTSDSHLTGTDRVSEVSSKIKADYYLIWMGDEPLIKFCEISKLINQIQKDKKFSAYMLAKPFTEPVDVVNPTTIKLAINKNQELIFMSRALIPFPKARLNFQYYKNIGAYVMTKETLDFFSKTPLGEIEEIEEIELLRLLENHKKVYVVLLKDSISFSVDTPKDLAKARQIIGGGGKLSCL